MSNGLLPPRKRDWTPGTYQTGYFVRDPHGMILEGVHDKATEENARELVALMCPTAQEVFDAASPKRTHKAQVEMAKAKETSDAYRSRHEMVNLVDFTEAWKVARQFDGGLPEKRPVDLPEDAKRAIVTLARLFVEMQREWT